MREARPDGKFVLTGEQSRLIEGFVADVIRDYGAGTCGPRRSGGTLDLHKQAEQLAARFIGTEAAVVIGAGFSTNSTIIPAVVGPGSLIISDELAHVSMRLGIKNSRAAFKNFRNNDMVHLEQILREVIPKGQPNGKPWKNILVAVEGLYSMDGTIVDLPGLLALKKKYKVCTFICYRELALIIDDSSTSTWTRLTPSVRLDLTDVVPRTISMWILPRSTS
jgi:7-keto-8-aminopelargonate synthetase-like enzyme